MNANDKRVLTVTQARERLHGKGMAKQYGGSLGSNLDVSVIETAAKILLLICDDDRKRAERHRARLQETFKDAKNVIISVQIIGGHSG